MFILFVHQMIMFILSSHIMVFKNKNWYSGILDTFSNKTKFHEFANKELREDNTCSLELLNSISIKVQVFI